MRADTRAFTYRLWQSKCRLILILLANRANPALCWPNVKIPVHNLSLLGRAEVIQLNLDLRVRGMN